MDGLAGVTEMEASAYPVPLSGTLWGMPVLSVMLIDPVLVLCLWAIVGTFCISMFLPLIELLKSLS